MKKKKKIICFTGIALLFGIITGTIALNYYSGNVVLGKTTTKSNKIYSKETQTELLKAVEKKKSKGDYTIDNPLTIMNPFKTNTTGLYIYFKTEDESMLEYTVHVDDENIGDFTRTLYNGKENNLTTEHEYSLIGLVGGMKNKVTLKLYDKDKNLIKTKEITVDAPKFADDCDIILDKENGDSTVELSDGLYFSLGYSNTKECYLYDNNGVARAEIKIDGHKIERPLYKDGLLYLSVDDSTIAAVNSLGYAEKIYDLGDYELHHDSIFAKDNTIISLATDSNEETKEDKIIQLDLTTGDVKQLADLKDMLYEYCKTTSKPDNSDKLDWIHLNSINFVNDTDVVISSRETSTIIKLNNIYNNPQIDYMIGHEGLWKDTPYADYLLTKVGDFTVNAGQHDVETIHDDSLEDGQYYLDMYNNNYGYSSTNTTFNWGSIEGINSNESMYYRYLVDENKRTFTLVSTMAVTRSDYVGNVQHYNGNIVTNSGNALTFEEHDSEGKLISKFKVDRDLWGIYRTFKVSGNNFVFYSED